MQNEVHDLVIIGGGPIGMCCAIEAKKAGLKFLVLEKGVLVNSLFHFPTNMTFFSTSELLEIGEVPFISHSEKPTRREALEYFRRVYESWQLNVQFYEPVTNMEPQGGDYLIVTTKNEYLAKKVIIATGFYDTPFLLNIPGESLPKVKHYYDEAHPYVGQKVLVIGAANSACDVALEIYHKGADVTMAIRSETISERVKYWIKPNIENRIKEGSIRAFFNTTVDSIHKDHVILHTPDGKVKLPNDFVLAMTGYQPNYKLLQQLGLEIDKCDDRLPQIDPDTLESNLPGVYLAGVVCSGMNTSMLFIENSRVHANIIVKHILANLKSSVQV